MWTLQIFEKQYLKKSRNTIFPCEFNFKYGLYTVLKSNILWKVEIPYFHVNLILNMDFTNFEKQYLKKSRNTIFSCEFSYKYGLSKI